MVTGAMPPDQHQRGAERAARLGLEKWEVVNLTYEDVVERPDYVVSIIRAYLEVRRPQGRQEPA
jgi:very-short-patch-repair endonuclease